MFCGHPAVDRLNKIDMNRKSFLNKIGVNKNKEICALLPGSRSNEIKRILPILIEFSKKIELQINSPPVFIVPVASNQENLVKKILHKSKNIFTIKNSEFGDTLIKNANIAIVTSGTATLEYALCGVPTLAIYKTGFLSAFVGRRIIDMGKVILPNWILGINIISFYFQEDCNAKYLANSFKNIHKNNNKIIAFNNYAKKLNLLLKVNKSTFKENIYKEIKDIIVLKEN